MDRTTEWELCSFWGKLQRGRDLQEGIWGHGICLGRKMKKRKKGERNQEKKRKMKATANNYSDDHILIQTHLLCTQGPPWTPGCPSAAAAVSECGQHPATSFYKQSAPQWWPAGAGRHLLRYRWWRAAWAGCLSRSARSLVSIQSHQHAPRAQTVMLPSFGFFCWMGDSLCCTWHGNINFGI